MIRAASVLPRYCVIGAGSSGLAVCKNFLEAGIPFDCFEREDNVGGNWYFGKPHSSVYRSTHLISSKRLTEYTDFPMPADYPAYPNHEQVWKYFRAYADHFGLDEHIQFNTSVAKVEKAVGGGWWVELGTGERREYAGVVIANGHNWDPKIPEYPGTFAGTVLHSSEYKSPDVLRGKRVLVIGAGNSGCDIAVESAQNAAKTFHSTRRGYHYVPKFLYGKPVDLCNETLLRLRLPVWLRRAITNHILGIAIGRPQNYGLPKPDHRLFETHPIINSQMLYYVGHGDIGVKPDVAEFTTDGAKFADGSFEPLEVVVYATGFNITMKFIDREYLNWHDGRPRLFMNVFHPTDETLFIAGLIQPDSGQWGLVDYQARLIAKFIAAKQNHPTKAAKFRSTCRKETGDLGAGIHYINSTRHYLEVEHFSYRERLKKLIRSLR